MPRKRKRDQDGIFARPDSPYWWASYTDGRGKPTRLAAVLAFDETKTRTGRRRPQ